MRCRWRWQWDQGETTDRALVIAGTWFAGGAISVAVIIEATKDGHGHSTAAGWLALAIWLTPMAIAALVVLVRAFVIHVWRNPPLRRVTEPVLEDLRARLEKIERDPKTSREVKRRFFRSQDGREYYRLQAEIDQLNAAIDQLDAEQAREDAHKARITNASQN